MKVSEFIRSYVFEKLDYIVRHFQYFAFPLLIQSMYLVEKAVSGLYTSNLKNPNEYLWNKIVGFLKEVNPDYSKLPVKDIEGILLCGIPGGNIELCEASDGVVNLQEYIFGVMENHRKRISLVIEDFYEDACAGYFNNVLEHVTDNQEYDVTVFNCDPVVKEK